MRTTAIIIILAIAFVIFFYGKKAISAIQSKMVEKERIIQVEKKIDSLFLENQKIIDTLAKQKDTIYYEIRNTIHQMDTIYEEVNNYVVAEEQDEIIKELKRLSK